MSIDTYTLVVLSNTIIMAITAIATIYRIKIEKKQTRITEENTEYGKRVETFTSLLDKEREEILSMSPQEIYDMLKKVWCEE
jgi:hypothetical protein